MLEALVWPKVVTSMLARSAPISTDPTVQRLYRCVGRLMLAERMGVRPSALSLAVGPLRKVTCGEHTPASVRAMGTDRAHYSFSKGGSDASPRAHWEL